MSERRGELCPVHLLPPCDSHAADVVTTGRSDCESSSSLLIVLPLSLSLLFFSFLPTVILEKPIRIPRSLSVKAASVLKGFLNKVRAIQSQSPPPGLLQTQQDSSGRDAPVKTGEPGQSRAPFRVVCRLEMFYNSTIGVKHRDASHTPIRE